MGCSAGCGFEHKLDAADPPDVPLEGGAVESISDTSVSAGLKGLGVR